MKKKIFNALLMGVLALTSVSTLVSCKDYDDDIDSLKLEQADLLTKLESLQSSVDGKVTEINTSIKAAQDAANKALETAQANGTNIDGLKTSISDAVDAAKEAGTAAAKAQTTANGAAEDADAAQKRADAAYELADQALKAAQGAATSENVQTALNNANSALSQLTDLNEKLGSLETLDGGIAGLVEDVNNAATKEELKVVSDKVDKYDNYFESLFAAVTSVEFYGTFSGTQDKFDMTKGLDIDLAWGIIGEDSEFGNDEAYDESTPIIKYAKNKNIQQTSKGIILRVNPVNAKLSTTDANCKIKLVNSKGESLDDFIEVASVEKYDELITGTRAATVNSGLWKVALKYKDGVVRKDFENAINYKKDSKTPVLFAVAVNNTDTTNEDRYVASTYDLALSDNDYAPADNLHYGVANADGIMYGTKSYINGKQVEDWIKNRYGQKVNGELISEEYTWKDEPATAIKEDKTNVVADKGDNDEYGDDRHAAPYLPVNVNSEFTISLDNTKDKIDYYYVTLDKAFAYESAPSEWNAWTSYSYEGLFETVKASEKHAIKITSEKANGDVIGFRVYAVNYDGTLVDPDGKAFYVRVGNEAGTQSVEGTIKIGVEDGKYTNSTILELPGSFVEWTKVNTYKGTLTIDEDASDGIVEGQTDLITYILLDADKKELTSASENGWKDAKYVKIAIKPQYLEDGGTFVASTKVMDGDLPVNTLKVTIKKEMPTTIPALTWKENQVKDGVYTCYVTPTKYSNVASIDWMSAATYGYQNLQNSINGLFDANYIWNFENAKYDDDKNVIDYELTTTSTTTPVEYAVQVHKDFIGKDLHKTTVTYNYKNISCQRVGGKYATVEDYKVSSDDVTANTKFVCILDGSVMKITGWKAGAKNEVTYGVSKSIDAATDLVVTNSVNNTDFGKWNRKFYKDVEVHLVSKTTGNVDDYFTVSATDEGKFVFTPKSTTQDPGDISYNLTIKCTDAFGHVMNYSVPFEQKGK